MTYDRGEMKIASAAARKCGATSRYLAIFKDENSMNYYVSATELLFKQL